MISRILDCKYTLRQIHCDFSVAHNVQYEFSIIYGDARIKNASLTDSVVRGKKIMFGKKPLL